MDYGVFELYSISVAQTCFSPQLSIFLHLRDCEISLLSEVIGLKLGSRQFNQCMYSFLLVIHFGRILALDFHSLALCKYLSLQMKQFLIYLSFLDYVEMIINPFLKSDKFWENNGFDNILIFPPRQQYKLKNYEDSLLYAESALKICSAPGLADMADKIRLRIASQQQ